MIAVTYQDGEKCPFCGALCTPEGGCPHWDPSDGTWGPIGRYPAAGGVPTVEAVPAAPAPVGGNGHG